MAKNKWLKLPDILEPEDHVVICDDVVISRFSSSVPSLNFKAGAHGMVVSATRSTVEVRFDSTAWTLNVPRSSLKLIRLSQYRKKVENV